MIPARRRLARALAALSALLVLSAPFAHLVHAETMQRDSVACSPAMAHAGMVPHHAHHPGHPGADQCCDQCPTSCATAVGLVAPACQAVLPSTRVLVVASFLPESFAPRVPHTFPFAIGPPSSVM